jgi:hypothetical protein
MYVLIIDCVDLEKAYPIKDEELKEILHRYYKTKDLNVFEKEMKNYIKKQTDADYKNSCIELLKHLIVASHFDWDCNYFFKKNKKEEK